MKSNPSGAIGFFSRKVLSQWIEPTYESILILLNRHAYTEVGQYPVNALPTNRFGAMLVRIMNLIQTLTYFGAFLFYTDAGIRRLKSRNAGKSRTLFRDYVNYLFPALILLGGFTFYIFWEANSQYALFFALLLIPCAVSGYGKTSDHVIDAFRHHSIKEEKSFGIPVITILLIVRS